MYWETPQGSDWFFLVAAGVAGFLWIRYVNEIGLEAALKPIINVCNLIWDGLKTSSKFLWNWTSEVLRGPLKALWEFYWSRPLSARTFFWTSLACFLGNLVLGASGGPQLYSILLVIGGVLSLCAAFWYGRKAKVTQVANAEDLNEEEEAA